MLNFFLVDPSEIEGVVCEDVEADEVDSLNPVVKWIEDFLRQNDGIGLAAVQIGIKKNFFVQKVGEGYRTFFNPKYFREDVGKVKAKEACFSYDRKKFIDTKRYKRIKVLYQEYKDGQLVDKVERFSGQNAIAPQHEIDHLNGKTIYTKFKDK